MLLYYGITTVHVIVCIILVLVVLLQSGKGADLAGAFGGGATQTAFGSRGPASFLSKMTTLAAIIFMLTSVGLSMLRTYPKAESKSVFETSGQGAQPVKTAPSTRMPAVPAPTPEQIRKQVEEAQKAAAAKKQQTPPAPKLEEPKPPANKQ
jgi:preprotein translocase subunit SecG